MLNRRAEAYESSGDLSSALADFEMIASKHPDFARDERVAVDICRLRSRLRAELSIVLESCKDMTGAGAAEARGLALLRAGQDAEALKAFSDGLVVQPVHAGLLYGRGIVRLRQGQWEDGDDDIAFARALNSQIGANFERYGVAAP